MNQLIEQFKRDVESFDEKFKKDRDDAQIFSGDYNQLKQSGFFVHPDCVRMRSTLHCVVLNLVVRIIEESKNRKKKEPGAHICLDISDTIEFKSFGKSVCVHKHEVDTHNSALSDTISQLDEFREYLLTNIKKI